MPKPTKNAPKDGERFADYVSRMQERLQVAGELIRKQEGTITKLHQACGELLADVLNLGSYSITGRPSVAAAREAIAETKLRSAFG